MLSSFDESKGRGGRGYADSNLAPSVSSVGSSIFGSIKRGIDSGDATMGVDTKYVIVRIIMCEVVAIEVDAVGEWI